MASERASGSIVEDWLRSVNLVQYTQAFLDNGYDDLEVCKQIGEDDLDAIGVPRDQHREKLLRAVRVLREEGGTAVYFTLEECDTCQSGDETEAGDGKDDESRQLHGGGGGVPAVIVLGEMRSDGGGGGTTHRVDVHERGKPPLVTYQRVQLKLMLRDKLVEGNIDLSGPPYTNSDLVVCGSSLTALAMRFAEELKTHFIDVLERLEELWMVARNNDLCSTMCRSPSHSVYTEEQSMHYGYPHYHTHHFHYPSSPRNQPPPLPLCPPPATMSSTHIDRCVSLRSHMESSHIRSDPFAHLNYAAVDGGVCCIFPRKIIKETAGSDDKKKSGSVFGRFFRNIGFRRSNRKGSYKQHQGDLNAYEISMSDEDRMALMILVKEGRISTETALAVVQRFEEERRIAGRTVASEEAKENVFDTPTKKASTKKKKGGKPPKSQSTLSADDPQRSQTCSQVGPPIELDQSCDHQMCRQRRVHSLGQLDIPHIRTPHHDHQHDSQHERISLAAALSCSPANTPSHKMISQLEAASSVARLHSPSFQQQQQFLQQQQQQPFHHHHHHHHSINKVDALRERFTGRSVNTVPKTSSKTSLLSSGSDQSMEFGSQTPLRADPMSRHGGDPAAYNSNSTVSMNSDTNSPASGRKKNVAMLDPRIKQTHRSASCSTGDDGISSENDEVDTTTRFGEKNSRHSSRRHLQVEMMKGKQAVDRSPRIKDGIFVRPPLLRQRSAPGGSPIFSGAYLGQAEAVVDYTPGPDEEDFVPLKKGEIVNIINMAQSGVWRGMVGNKRGKFLFEHVRIITEPDKVISSKMFNAQKDVPKSVGDLLQKIGLVHLTTVFMQNGYDDLDIFSELDDHDLDTLHITDTWQRTKLLSAAKVLVGWHEKMNARSSALTTVDSPSSRAGNSSCDSGCYAGGESKNMSRCQEGGTGGGKVREKKSESASGHNKSPVPHTPCRSCGKPKQPRKYCGPPVVTHYMPGQYAAQTPLHGTPNHVPPPSASPSPLTPGHFPYTGPQPYGPYSPGHYRYHYSTGHSFHGQGHPHYTMSASRTLTELNVADNHNAPVHLETFVGRKNHSNSTSPVYADKLSITSSRPTGRGDKGSLGDRVSLTEEDQEVIAITYGTNQPRKLATPILSLNSGSSQLDMSNNLTCSTCIPSPGCPQCEEIMLNDSSSCQQCAAYMSCPQCFPYRHYVNTAIRSESKSSKMSCSSTCTQTTCLSPDHDDSSHSGGSNQIDYMTGISSRLDYTTSPHGGYYVSKSSPGRTQHYYCCQQQFMQHQIYSHPPNIPQPSTPSRLSPVPAPPSLANSHPITLALTDTNVPQGLSLTLKPEAPPLPPPSLAPPTDWGGHSEDDDAPGIATLYSRGRSQTPEKVEKGDGGGQLKSPTRSLMPLVSTKLSAEMIDLTQIPYSTVIGHCGIPPLLVQRYSEELRQDIATMSMVLEQLREKQLRGLGRPCIQNESLGDSCKNACDLQISSIQNFLVSIGLPMYQKSLTEGGISSLEQLLKLKESELEQMTGADSRHLRRVGHALEWVRHKLSSPSHKARTTTGITDKV